jgi:hypothetical protein
MRLLSAYFMDDVLQNINEYQSEGIKELTAMKKDFVPFNFNGNGEKEKAAIAQFIDVFCEHQLADNDYMNINIYTDFNHTDASAYYNLSLEDLLKHITHIIWTDKAVVNYFVSKVQDNTIYHLLNRMEKISFDASSNTDKI